MNLGLRVKRVLSHRDNGQSKHVHHSFFLLSLRTSFLCFQSVWQKKYCYSQLKFYFLSIQERLPPIRSPWETLTSEAHKLTVMVEMRIVLKVIRLQQTHLCEYKGKLQGPLGARQISQTVSFTTNDRHAFRRVV